MTTAAPGENFRQSELDKFGALAQPLVGSAGPQKALHASESGAARLRGRRARRCAARRARCRLRRRPAQRSAGARRRGRHRDRPCAGPDQVAQAAPARIAASRSTTAAVRSRRSPRERRHASTSITCMEMLEHVPDPAAILAACASLLKPGGRLFLSTLNRTPAAFALAIVGAEYVARLLPKGTHHYARFHQAFGARRLAARGRPRAGRRQRPGLRTRGAMRAAHRAHRHQLSGLRAKPAHERGAATDMSRFHAVVLFDLDGTLLDSAPDMLATRQPVRAERGRAPMTLAELRPHVVARFARDARERLPGSDADRARCDGAGVPRRLPGADSAGTACCSTTSRHCSRGSRPTAARWGIVTNKPEYLAARDPAAAGLGRRVARC